MNEATTAPKSRGSERPGTGADGLPAERPTEYLDTGLPNPSYYRDEFDDKIEELERQVAGRAEEMREIEERAALQERKLADLRGEQSKVHREVGKAEEESLEKAMELDALHGDHSRLVKAVIDVGLTAREVKGRFAEDEFAEEVRSLAAMMDIPDWLKEEDLANQMKQEAVACRIKTRELLQKAQDRVGEAKKAAIIVKNVQEETGANSKSTAQRIQKRFSILRAALDEREAELLAAVEANRKEKLSILEGQMNETERNVQNIQAAVDEGEVAMDRDDLGYIDAYLHRIDDRLEKASVTFTSMETYAQADFPLSFGHRGLRADIGAHGTIGSIEALTGGPRGHGILLWDDSRTEDKLEITEKGRGIRHVGPAAGKSTAISELGFGSGRNIWHLELHGLENGQWISVGVCTAALINSKRYAQDAVIFQASVSGQEENNAGGTDKHAGVAEKFQVTNKDIIMVALDCEGAVVEYYKNKTCIKTAMLMVFDKPKVETKRKDRKRTSEGHTDGAEDAVPQTNPAEEGIDEDLVIADTVWYPFATLYQMGHEIKFTQ
jgi:hypothetical protein